MAFQAIHYQIGAFDARDILVERFMPDLATSPQGSRHRGAVAAVSRLNLFTRVELQWRGVRLYPGVIKFVMNRDEPSHLPDEVIAEILD